GTLFLSRKCLLPAAIGDERCWPSFQSPVLYPEINIPLHFLIDTGAEVSVLAPALLTKRGCLEHTLQAANGAAIATCGTQSLTLNLGLRRTFCLVFLVGDVTTPIIGADFLRHFYLLVDMRHYKVIDKVTCI
uniref:Peptidase A2 domain-containing protein n=1 Tax=Amphimedon queenslandica TaxID=400682 RepID=A0A1X7UUG2_AMPQE